MNGKYQRLYKKAKNIMQDKTPLKKDCGLLCGKACCKGDAETGMLLFPFEETSLPVTEKNGVRLCVCDGSCNRRERPLSCMIFPFFPYITRDGRIKVIPDIRGSGICPIVRNFTETKIDRRFLRRVKKVGRLLSEDDECRAFLEEISRETDVYLELLE
ncbi:MAG: hypothetical protein IIX36_08420 [Clostridia bacterium]|nr:hypothetical protein [Clostridia bacterium]